MSTNYEVLKDPIHGYIQVFDHEKKLIDTAIFQRLRRIHQNTGVHYTYPGATHSRFSHSLGVMHIAGIFVERLLEKIPNLSSAKRRKYYYLMRLWGLTHDIGHGPFSHIFDDVIFGLPRYNTDHEKFGGKILRECTELPRTLSTHEGIQIDMDEVASLFEVKSVEEWPFKKRIGESQVRETVFYYICRGAYSADIIDFLLRDSYFTGAGYGNIDWERLVFSSIPVKDKVVLDPRGEEAFDSLLLARLFMFSTVYYHRTTRAAIKVITQFLTEAAPRLEYFNAYIQNVNNFKNLDEESLLTLPELSDSIFRKQLIERKIPYTRFKERKSEISLDISEKALSNTLSQETRNKLPTALQSIPEHAFFVDTPTFKLNPLFGEEEQYIFILDSSQPDGYRARRVLETSWGTLQKKILLMRLYIHDDYRSHENEIVNAFTQRRTETHV